MKSRTTRKFWKHFNSLSPDIQQRATVAFDLWSSDPHHPSLHFKRVDDNEPIFSARVGKSHRALCVMEEDAATWFWIGTHDDYERLLS